MGEVSTASYLKITAELVLLQLANGQYYPVGNITDALVTSGSKVRRAMGEDVGVHGTATFQLAKRLAWAEAFVRPRIVLENLETGQKETHNVGVFRLEIPEFSTGVEPAQWSVQAHDVTSVLDYPVGRTLKLPAGTSVTTAVVSLLSETAGSLPASVVPSGAVLPSGYHWPIDEANTYRCVIDQLLDAIGYERIYADRNGVLQAIPYAQPLTRRPVTDIPEEAIRHPVRWQSDLSKQPNRWIFILDDPGALLADSAADTAVLQSGVYEILNSFDGPGSVTGRGNIVQTKVVRVPAASQAALRAYGDRVVQRDLWPQEQASLQCSPYPEIWHNDTVYMTIPELGWLNRVVEVIDWELPLDGGDMHLTVRSVYADT